jgi:uncharacterized membrane protein YdjX (TVP38/TMEM64 family)
MTTSSPSDSPEKRSSRRRRASLATRLIPVGVILLLLVLLFAFGPSMGEIGAFVTENREAWNTWSATHPLLAAGGFALFYAVAVTVSLPGALWFTIAAGFLLGAGTGFFVSLFGATVGAVNIFLIARYVAGRRFAARFGSSVRRFARGFRRDAFTYMILLRMVPTPFFGVNVAAALLGVRLRDYTLGTMIGAIGPTVLYANLGAVLDDLTAGGFRPTLADFTRPEVIIALLAALVLAPMPLVYRAWMRRQPSPKG